MPGNRNSKGKYKKPAPKKPEKLEAFPDSDTVDPDTFADELPLLNAQLVPKFVDFALNDPEDHHNTSLNVLCNYRQIGIPRAGDYPDDRLLSMLIARPFKKDSKVSILLAKPFPPYRVHQDKSRHTGLLVLSRWIPTATERILLELISSPKLWSEEDSVEHPIVEWGLNAKLCMNRRATFCHALKEGNICDMMEPAIQIMRLLQKHKFTAPISHPLVVFIRSHRWFDHSAFAPGLETMGSSGFYILRTQSDHEAMSKEMETTYDKLDKVQPRS